MEIKRSPFTFVMEKNSMTLTLTTKPIEAGWVEWPVYKVNDKYYLQERFDLVVPSGVEVIKITLDTFRGQQVSKCIIMDIDSNANWFDNMLYTAPIYPRIGVTQNRVYHLKTNDLTLIDYDNGKLKLEWSYSINKSTITVEDYIED